MSVDIVESAYISPLMYNYRSGYRYIVTQV